jgi:hypothetical protein
MGWELLYGTIAVFVDTVREYVISYRHIPYVVRQDLSNWHEVFHYNIIQELVQSFTFYCTGERLLQQPLEIFGSADYIAFRRRGSRGLKLFSIAVCSVLRR